MKIHACSTHEKIMNSILTSAVKLFEVSNVREMHKNNPEKPPTCGGHFVATPVLAGAKSHRTWAQHRPQS